MKLKPYLLAAASITAVAVCTPLTSFAAPTKSASPSASPSPSQSASPSEKPARALPFHGTVSSIDASAKTFTITGKTNSRVFKVTDKTTVTKDGAAATFADITADAKVGGSYWKQTDGSLECKTVKLGGNSDASRSGSSKKGKKKSKGDKADESTGSSPSASPSDSSGD